MLTALAILGVLVALFLAAALATREDEALAPAPRDAADLDLPAGPVRADDVRGLRFGLAARGYRMSEVDEALERLAVEIEARDRRIEELESTAAEGPRPGGVPDPQDAEPVRVVPAERQDPVRVVPPVQQDPVRVVPPGQQDPVRVLSPEQQDPVRSGALVTPAESLRASGQGRGRS